MFYKIKKKHVISILTLIIAIVISFSFFKSITNNPKQNSEKTSNIHTQEISETDSKDTQSSDVTENYGNPEIISRHYIYEKDVVPHVILLDQ
ncbi:hypothetical protein [Clostridium kluyveri]|uniref:Uncharacterized protein n=1 Tax=Clostridium kluyveri TaxID=1534 RepID=A0A1L5F9Z1_CLOKL|nr:hypothetical protein [Clostridium kluyveri]APM39812.1 hypothetical protein BS101_14240 [Clostridium kluyveri]UZQ50027.1 hypothetical protein OP486_19090 [Clostridium kluyveri]